MNTMEYILKKILTMVVTLFLVSVVVFLIFDVLPGDSVSVMLGTNSTDERAEQLREEMGLDRPVYERYGNWLVDFVKGDFGTSLKYRQPVSKIVGEKLPVTLWLAGLSLVLTFVFSIPLGVFLAWRTYIGKGRLVSIVNQIIMSVPAFFLGIVIIIVFGVELKFFLPGAYVDYSKDFAGFLGYIFPAAFAIAIPKTAMIAKFTKNTLVEQLEADYVRTARSIGVGTVRLMRKYVLRNGLLPVITFFGMMIAETMAGSVVVEQVFNIPGIGRILVTAVSNRDFPVVQTIVLYIAIVVIIVNCLVDIIYKLVDPRVSVGIQKE